MSAKPHDGALTYLDEQIDALKEHVPAALEGFDPTGVHQARVATRRLKAGLDLFASLLDKGDTDTIAPAGKKLRRRLGPLRDLDVMIDHLKDYPAPVRLRPAVEWIRSQFEQERREARDKDQKKGKKPRKLLEQFENWWSLRHKLEASLPAIESLLAEALHERFDRFSEEADWVSNVVETPADKLPLDVHVLRIDGKALRYTFEIADAQGLRIPKAIFKTFKAMQESLGAWHDSVVLAERTMGRSVEVQLAHHDPDAAALALDLAKQFLKDSVKSLNQFKSKWKRSGQTLRNTLHDRVPLTRDVSNEISLLSESKTDPDRPEQGAIPPQASPMPTAPEAEPV